jgi:hypothetical protein
MNKDQKDIAKTITIAVMVTSCALIVSVAIHNFHNDILTLERSAGYVISLAMLGATSVWLIFTDD